MKLNFRLKGYFSRYLWTIRYGNGCTTTVPLEVFTQRNFVVDFIQLKLTFIPKKTKEIAFGATLSGFKSNVRTQSIACWKVRGRLYIRHNWTFSLLQLSGNLSKSAFIERGWVTLSTDFTGNGASPTNHCWCQSSSGCPFMWYQNICSASFGFVTIHACDRQTDGQNYDSQDRPRIFSCSKNQVHDQPTGGWYT